MLRLLFVGEDLGEDRCPRAVRIATRAWCPSSGMMKKFSSTAAFGSRPTTCVSNCGQSPPEITQTLATPLRPREQRRHLLIDRLLALGESAVEIECTNVFICGLCFGRTPTRETTDRSGRACAASAGQASRSAPIRVASPRIRLARDFLGRTPRRRVEMVAPGRQHMHLRLAGAFEEIHADEGVADRLADGQRAVVAQDHDMLAAKVGDQPLALLQISRDAPHSRDRQVRRPRSSRSAYAAAAQSPIADTAWP